MDAVEIARRKAADLHAQAVARGLDPTQLYAFAVSAARHQGLDVETARPDSDVFRGARATLVPRDELIVHTTSGTDFERAFLVAHEVGHFVLGDDDLGPTGESDPARPAEACPVGADRVVDYGRRQRREVQMDLFARELLLPRPLVRRLHLEGGLTASAIASRYGAPFDVVGQQLFDALLLPEVPDPIEEPVTGKPLNEEQRVAAGHRGEAYLLGAGPGTGKTQTLAARVEGLLEDGVDPRRILVLTFSNKAAGEMADRIARKSSEAAVAMWIGTFHAFGLDVIRRFHTELSLPKDPRMLDRTEAAELLENEFPRLGLVEYRNIYDPTETIDKFLAAFSRAKDEVADPTEYAERAAAMAEVACSDEERVAAARASEVARAYAAYEALKREAHCVDFGDLVALPVRLMETNSSVREYFQKLYEHVLVDEYQDVNRASVRLLKALCGSGRNLWAVGDGKQSIYRFRGASSFSMSLFDTDFADASRGQLRINYRSVPEVVDAFSTFATNMSAGGAAEILTAHRTSAGHAPELRIVESGDVQNVVLADAIGQMRSEGIAYRDQAVLCTGNERLTKIGRELERLSIPVLFLGSLFERSEVKELLALLSILVDRRAMGLVRVACRAEFSLSLGEVYSVTRHLRDQGQKPLSWLGDAGSIPGLSPDGIEALGALRRALNGFKDSSSPWTVLATVLLDRTRWAAEIAGSTEVADRAKGIAIWQFMSFVRVQPAGKGLPVTRLLDRVRRLLRLGDDRDLRQLPAAAQGIDAVRLMTVHGAKGLEFSAVHFPGMNSDTMPRAFRRPECPPPNGMIQGGSGSAETVLRSGHAEEQECLFYVALSRARDRLLLFAAASTSNGSRRPLSRFLDFVSPGLRRVHVEPSRQPVPGPEDAAVSIAVHGALRFGVAQLGLYERCPRRFLYTYVLELGGRRTTTAFMQMHEAARLVVQGIIAAAPGSVSPADLEVQLDDAFAACGLADHGYVGDYRALALAMIQYFVVTRTDHGCEPPTAVSLKFGDEEVVVTPDDILIRPDGTRIVRRVLTGHGKKSHDNDLAAAAFLMAVTQAFPGAITDIVYLADAGPKPRTISLTPKVVGNRRIQVSEILAAIRAGSFPTDPSERACPGCPAFFVCGPAPSGTLTRKF